MSNRKPIKTTIEEAVEYWSKRIDECDLSVDWSEANTHCWRCGCEKNLERCHIIPHSLGGEDAPHNIVLLCKRCHTDGPNVKDTQIMWDWIKAYKVPFYETFWGILGLKEYKFVYGKSVLDEVKDILEKANLKLDEEIENTIKEITKEVMEDAGIHFGHPYFNTATMAGINRMMLKKFANYYGVDFPSENTEEILSTTPWWFE